MRSCLLPVASVTLIVASAHAENDAPAPVIVRSESSLATGSRQIRQYAFDGDRETYFASEGRATANDDFTLHFDKPVRVKAITVVSGRPDGTDTLEAGALQVSSNSEQYEELFGGQFEELAKFEAGTAGAKWISEPLQAVRIKPAADLNHPLVIREITIDSEPPLQVFLYPVEIVVNVDDAPEMREWAEKTARICERAYPLINEELKSDGYRPPARITMTLRKDYRGVAATSGTRITGSVKFFTDHPDDVGAMVHETTHVVQRYRSRDNPGWLVEGVADYVRFFKFEPGNLGRINPRTAHYNSSYRVTAAFLAYLVEKYDDQIVRKLNQLMREGKYTDAVWEELTGKPVETLDEEWRATLPQ
jgi:hypothetical protein